MKTAAAPGPRSIALADLPETAPGDPTGPAVPGRGHLSERRRRPLSGQAHRRRAGRGLGRHLPRWPRRARRPSCSGASEAEQRLAARADAPPRQRPLDGRVHARRARPLSLRDRSLDRPVRHLAARAPAQARGRAQTSRSRRRRAASCSRAASRATPTRGGRSSARRTRVRPQRGDVEAVAVGRAGGRGGGERAARRPDPQPRRFRSIADRPRARAGAWYEMVPRSQGTRARPARHLRRLHRAAAGHRRARLRRALSAADPSDRHDQPQGPQQCAASAAPGRSRQPLRHRLRRRRPRRRPSRARHARRFPPLRRRLPRRTAWRWRSISPSSARPIIPGCSEHPEWFKRRPDGSIHYAENPPKKYEDIVNPDFYCADRDRAVGGAARRRAVLGRAGRAHLPRRQSAHQAVPVLGMADPRGAGARSRRDLPVGGVHAAEGDEGAGQARLHPVLHLFHLAHRARRSCRPI